MATRVVELELLRKGEGCFAKAHDDEPIFILRAQDKLAPGIIEQWALEAEREWHGTVSDTADRARKKIAEARALAHQMRAWQELHRTKRPD